VIPTVHIIVSYSRDAIVELLSSNSLSSFIESQSSSKDTIVFSNRANSNFLSLKHTATQKGGANSIGLELEFLDPEGVFTDSLKKVLNNPFAPSAGLLQQLLGDATANLEAAKVGTEDVDQLTKIKGSLEKDINSLNEIGSPVPYTGYGLDLSKETYDKKLTKYNEHKAFLDNLLQDKIPNEHKSVYVTYGVGNDVNYWAPVMCFDKVLGVEFSFSTQGAKIIKFKYDGVSVHSNLTEDNVFVKQLYGREVSIAGHSNKIFNREHTERLGEYYGEEFSTKFSTYKPSLHEPIVETLRNFANTAVNNRNTVVLFPDLDALLKPQVENSLRNHRYPDLDNKSDITPYVSVLTANGFTVTKTPPQPSKDKYRVSPNLQEIAFQLNENPELFLKKEFLDLKAQSITVRSTLVSDGINRNFLDTLQNSLKTLSTKINANPIDSSISKKVTFVHRMETDFQVLKLLHEQGIIADPSIPALIIGDEDTISKVLDGNISEESVGNIAGLHNPLSILDSKDKFTEEFIKKAYSIRVGFGSGPLGSNITPDEAVSTNLGKLNTFPPIFTFGNKDPNILNIELDVNLILTSKANGINRIPDTDNLITSVLGSEPKREDEFLVKIKKLIDDNRGNTLVPQEFKNMVLPFYVDSKVLTGTEKKVSLGVIAANTISAFASEYTGGDGAEESFTFQNVAERAGIVYTGIRPGYFNHQGFFDFIEELDINSERFDEGDDYGQHQAIRWLWDKMVELFDTKDKIDVTLDSGESVLTGEVQTVNSLSDEFVAATVKTLPFFHLSTFPKVLTRNIYLIATEPAFVGTAIGEQQFLEKNSWLTGIYRMYGFTHIVSSSDVSSEFVIARTPASKTKVAIV
jgi:hypothetical protein